MTDRRIITALAALLISLLSCGPSTPTPPPLSGTAVDPGRIEGQVLGASFPDGRAFLSDSGSDHLLTDASGTFRAPATLSLELGAAGAAALAPLLPIDQAGCTFSGPPPAATLSVGDRVTILSPGNDLLGHVTETLSAGQPGAGQLVVRIHSDLDTAVTGTLTCPEQPPVTYTLSLRQGWNAATRAVTASGTTFTDLPARAHSQLNAGTAAPSVTLQLPEAGLHFDDMAPVTAPVTIQQVGGYSGRVTLSTDVPGLTVQPATVTLPPLGLQTLSTGAAGAVQVQQITASLRFEYAPGPNRRQPFSVIVTGSSGTEVGRGRSTIEVTRPGFTLSTRDTELELDPVAGRSVPVCVSSEGQYHGPVTLGIAGLPAGVAMTPATVDLDDFACGLVQIHGAGITRGSTSGVTLTAEGGGYHAQLAATLTVLGPAVSLGLVEPTVTVYRSSATSVPVQVTAEYGFSGPVQVGLRAVPDGIQTGVITVNVRAGETITVSVPLSATATAVLGVSSLVPVSPEELTAAAEDGATLRVRPPRRVVASGRLLAPSNTGVWQRTDGGRSTASSTLTRSGAGSPVTVQVPGSVDRLISTSGGVLALSGAGGSALVSDDGRVQLLGPPPSGPGHDLADATDVSGLV